MTMLESNCGDVAAAETCDKSTPVDPLLADFDPFAGLIASHVHADPYHTSLASGTPVHLVRESAGLALELLRRNQAGDVTTAEQILTAVCSLQDTREGSPTSGVWPYYLEESLDEMSPPDHNWADFVGARLCHVLVEHAHQIRPETCHVVTTALQRATEAICRRDVSPDYTNIAIMGGVVSICAGEQLGRPDWIRFGTAKLRGVVESAERHGSFPEYNSPTYTLVALEEAGRGLRLLRSADALEIARQLADTAWRLIASHWHPGTQQWAGPYARAYADTISNSLRQKLTAVTCFEHATPSTDVGLPSCPPDAVARFERLPRLPHHFEERCAHADAERAQRLAVTHFDRDFCLGAFSHGYYWDQSRSLIAHIQNAGHISVLRTRMLLNGRDFAGAGSVQAVAETSVLSSTCFWSGTGAFHPIFDAPPTGIFDAKLLELRVQVSHSDSAFRRLDPNTWVITIAGVVAHVSTPPASFNGRALEWRAETDGSLSMLRCVIIDNPRGVDFDPHTSDTELGFAVDLCRSDVPRFGPPRLAGNQLLWSAQRELQVPVRRRSSPRLW